MLRRNINLIVVDDDDDDSNNKNNKATSQFRTEVLGPEPGWDTA
jgi:hypothetical protein